MPSFYYRARDLDGRPHEGVEVANSEEDMLRLLENAQLVPVSIETGVSDAEAAPGMDLGTLWRNFEQRLKGTVKPASVALFARQLSTMVARDCRW